MQYSEEEGEDGETAGQVPMNIIFMIMRFNSSGSQEETDNWYGMVERLEGWCYEKLNGHEMSPGKNSSILKPTHSH